MLRIAKTNAHRVSFAADRLGRIPGILNQRFGEYGAELQTGQVLELPIGDEGEIKCVKVTEIYSQIHTGRVGEENYVWVAGEVIL